MSQSKEEPRLVEFSVASSAGGKVQIEEYGKITSDYFVSFSQKFAIPEDWSRDEAEIFQVRQHAELRELVDGLAQEEFDQRFEQSYMGRSA